MSILCFNLSFEIFIDEFKPQSADSAKLGLLCHTEEKSVFVESQNKQIGKSKVTFEGTSEEYKENDAVLFFDGETLRLELIDKAVEQLQHIQKPGESSTVAAATVADSSPIAKSRKLAPFSSARSSFETASVSAYQLSLS
jgi:ELL-associated factor